MTEPIDAGRSQTTEQTTVKERLDLFIKNKILYHGSTVRGITSFNPAEEDTIGSGVYFTSEEKDAQGYALRRAKGRGGSPVVYKVEVENIKLANLTEDENVTEIMKGFKDILVGKITPNLKWYELETIARSVQAIENGRIHAGNLREVTFNYTKTFSEYLKGLGYDGLVAIEGGEGDEIGRHDSYVIFNPEKAKILDEHFMN